MDRDDAIRWVVLIIIIATLAGMWVWIAGETADCERRGGVLLRGVMSMQCVALERR